MAARFYLAGRRGDGAFNERLIIFALSESHVEVRVYGGGGVRVVERARTVRKRQPVRAGPPERPHLCPGPGQQRLHLPAIGLGVIAAEAKRITDEMFFVAAKALADQVTPADLDLGRLYPPFTRIRPVSAAIATAVAELAYERGLAEHPRPADLSAFVKIADVRACVSQLCGTDRRIAARRGRGHTAGVEVGAV